MTMPAANGDGPAGGQPQQVGPPRDLAQVIARVREFHPENQPDLIHFMAGEMAGMVGYADALSQVVDNCVNSTGLDPASVSGISDYSAAVTDAAAAMKAAHKQFVTIYQEIIEATDKGVKLPYDGRWFNAA